MAPMIGTLTGHRRPGPQPGVDPVGPPTMLAVTPPLPFLILYGRSGCHLCEDARRSLDALLADRLARGLPAPQIVERSIEDDDDLQRRYALTIPVIVLGDQELGLVTTAGKLRRFLAEVLDGDGVSIR